MLGMGLRELEMELAALGKLYRRKIAIGSKLYQATCSSQGYVRRVGLTPIYGLIVKVTGRHTGAYESAG